MKWYFPLSKNYGCNLEPIHSDSENVSSSFFLIFLVQRALSWTRFSPSIHNSISCAQTRIPPQWGGRGTSFFWTLLVLNSSSFLLFWFIKISLHSTDWLWLLPQALIWLPLLLEVKYSSLSDDGEKTAIPLTRTWRPILSQWKTNETSEFFLISCPFFSKIDGLKQKIRKSMNTSWKLHFAVFYIGLLLQGQNFCSLLKSFLGLRMETQDCTKKKNEGCAGVNDYQMMTLCVYH